MLLHPEILETGHVCLSFKELHHLMILQDKLCKLLPFKVKELRKHVVGDSTQLLAVYEVALFNIRVLRDL